MSNTSLLGSFGGQAGDALMFRNRIINGGMDIWQRGDNTTGSGFFADRWLILSGVTTAVENAAGSPAGFRRNALITRNVSGSAIIAQRIEAKNCYDLAGQSVTVTFYHVSNAGQIDSIKVGLKYANTEDTFSATTLIQEVTLSSSATGWKTVTFNALPSQAANGLQLEFTYAVTGSSSVRLTGVQLESGAATPFERRPYSVELDMCQRYTVVYGGRDSYEYVGIALAGTGTVAYAAVTLPVQMRNRVTLVSSVGAFRLDDRTNSFPVTSIAHHPSSLFIGDKTVEYQVTVSGGLTAKMPYFLEANNDLTARLIISAEL